MVWTGKLWNEYRQRFSRRGHDAILISLVSEHASSLYPHCRQMWIWQEALVSNSGQRSLEGQTVLGAGEGRGWTDSWRPSCRRGAVHVPWWRGQWVPEKTCQKWPEAAGVGATSGCLQKKLMTRSLAELNASYGPGHAGSRFPRIWACWAPEEDSLLQLWPPRLPCSCSSASWPVSVEVLLRLRRRLRQSDASDLLLMSN